MEKTTPFPSPFLLWGLFACLTLAGFFIHHSRPMPKAKAPLQSLHAAARSKFERAYRRNTQFHWL